MTRLRAVVFDLDGTLCDSVPDIAFALNGALASAGLCPLDHATVKKMVGGGAETLIERALRYQKQPLSAALINDLLADFLVRYRERPCAQTVLYDGASEVLEQLRARDLELGICTNKPSDLTRLVLDALGLRTYFGGVTAYTRAPAEGRWTSKGSTKPEEVIVVEVMVDKLDETWWEKYRKALETKFRQDKIVIRAQIVKLL